MKSKWVSDIKGLEHIQGYKIYEDGTVESYWKNGGNTGAKILEEPVRNLKPMMNHKGYYRVELKG